MKKLNSNFLLFLFISSLTISCSIDDYCIDQNVAVEFSSLDSTFTENGGMKSIPISLSHPTSTNSFITVLLNEEDSEKFTTIPATVQKYIDIQIPKGHTAAEIKFIPVDRSTYDENTIISFTIVSVSEGLTIGTNKTFTATIVDKENASEGSFADFVVSTAELDESAEAGIEIEINFSEPLSADGQVEIKLETESAVYGQNFRTEPETINGRLSLPVESESTKITFHLLPINNSIITGEQEINLSIINTSGLIKKGGNSSLVVIISDDELKNKPKGYEVGGGSWQAKRTYEYEASGKIYKVHDVTRTPHERNFLKTYIYYNTGKLHKILQDGNRFIQYIWIGDQIIKSETIVAGIVQDYTEYDYDNENNITGIALYSRQPDNSFKLSKKVGYLYFSDGNIYKQLTYVPTGGSDTLSLSSTHTYDGYINVENPFPMVEILPNIKTQKKLPSTFRIEANGHDILYNMTYEFRNDGRVVKRRASSSAGTETANYFYY